MYQNDKSNAFQKKYLDIHIKSKRMNIFPYISFTQFSLLRSSTCQFQMLFISKVIYSISSCRNKKCWLKARKMYRSKYLKKIFSLFHENWKSFVLLDSACEINSFKSMKCFEFFRWRRWFFNSSVCSVVSRSTFHDRNWCSTGGGTSHTKKAGCTRPKRHVWRQGQTHW